MDHFKTSLKLAVFILILPCIAQAEFIKYVTNPYTGRLDSITSITTNTIIPGNNVTVVCTTGTCIVNATASGGGGSAPTLAVGTGTSTGYTGVLVSSPTSIILFDNATHGVSLQGASTAFVTLLPSSVTLQGNTNTFLAVGLTTATLQSNINTLYSNFKVSGSTGILGNIATSILPPATTIYWLNSTSAQQESGNITGSLVIGTSVTVSSNSFLSSDATFYYNAPVAVSSMQAVSQITWANGTVQVASPIASVTSINVGGGLGGGGGPGVVLVNLPNNVTGYIQNTPASAQQASINITGSVTAVSSSTFGALTSTDTFIGNTVYKGGLYYSSATLNGTSGIITSNYTTTLLDNVILASAPANGLTITLNFSSMSFQNSTGQDLLIEKVNQSSNSVTIINSGSDLIEGTTRAWILNAPGQHCGLFADGAGNWWEDRAGCQATPPYINPINTATNASAVVTTSSNVYFTAVYVPVPSIIQGCAFDQTVQGGVLSQEDCGVYDAKGNRLGNAGATFTFAAGYSTMSFTNPVSVPAGWYITSVTMNNTLSAIAGSTPGGAMPGWSFNTQSGANTVPATLTLPGTKSTKTFYIDLIVAGGATF